MIQSLRNEREDRAEVAEKLAKTLINFIELTVMNRGEITYDWGDDEISIYTGSLRHGLNLYHTESRLSVRAPIWFHFVVKNEYILSYNTVCYSVEIDKTHIERCVDLSDASGRDYLGEAFNDLKNVLKTIDVKLLENIKDKNVQALEKMARLYYSFYRGALLSDIPLDENIRSRFESNVQSIRRIYYDLFGDDLDGRTQDVTHYVKTMLESTLHTTSMLIEPRTYDVALNYVSHQSICSTNVRAYGNNLVEGTISCDLAGYSNRVDKLKFSIHTDANSNVVKFVEMILSPQRQSDINHLIGVPASMLKDMLTTRGYGGERAKLEEETAKTLLDVANALLSFTPLFRMGTVSAIIRDHGDVTFSFEPPSYDITVSRAGGLPEFTLSIKTDPSQRRIQINAPISEHALADLLITYPRAHYGVGDRHNKHPPRELRSLRVLLSRLNNEELVKLRETLLRALDRVTRFYYAAYTGILSSGIQLDHNLEKDLMYALGEMTISYMNIYGKFPELAEEDFSVLESFSKIFEQIGEAIRLLSMLGEPHMLFMIGRTSYYVMIDPELLKDPDRPGKFIVYINHDETRIYVELKVSNITNAPQIHDILIRLKHPNKTDAVKTLEVLDKALENIIKTFHGN